MISSPNNKYLTKLIYNRDIIAPTPAISLIKNITFISEHLEILYPCDLRKLPYKLDNLFHYDGIKYNLLHFIPSDIFVLYMTNKGFTL